MFKKKFRENYNLVDFAKKTKNKNLPRTKVSINKEYEILNLYKQKKKSKSETIKKLCLLREITEIEARNILENIKNNNITPMKFK